MKRTLACLVYPVGILLFFLGVHPSEVQASGGPGAKLALHVADHAVKGRCSTATPNGTNTPCTSFVTRGNLHTTYDVYVVLAQVPSRGATSAFFGIQYDKDSGSGVDIFDWEGCSDTEAPGNGWPNSGGGIVVTWDTCQQEIVGEDEILATIGSFYTYAYSEDSIKFTTRTYAPVPDIGWSDCNGSTCEFEYVGAATAIVSFGEATGCNPCLDSCQVDIYPSDCMVPTEPVTWGGIKLRNRGN